MTPRPHARYAPRATVALRLTLAPLAQGRTDPTMQRDAIRASG